MDLLFPVVMCLITIIGSMIIFFSEKINKEDKLLFVLPLCAYAICWPLAVPLSICVLIGFLIVWLFKKIRGKYITIIIK